MVSLRGDFRYTTILPNAINFLLKIVRASGEAVLGIQKYLTYAMTYAMTYTITYAITYAIAYAIAYAIVTQQ